MSGEIFTVLNDLIVIIFDLLIYAQMIEFRKNTAGTRRLVYGACGIIVIAYMLGTYVFGIPASVGTVVFMSVPSLVIFFLASKYRDSRFFLTFCFVDTVSLAIGFFARWLGIEFGTWGQAVGFAALIVVFSGIYSVGKPHFKKYRMLMEYTQRGWFAMMISAALTYVMMAALAAYPKPLVERLEYLPVYGLVCVAVLAHYAVMLMSIFKNKKLFDQHQQMERQQKWYHIAYWDALTGAPNRAAYEEYVNDLARRCEAERNMVISIAVLDLDGFKEINDRWGHTRGDEILKDFAKHLMEFFSGQENRVFRIGGDEFAVISEGIEEDALIRRFEALRAEKWEICAFSMGCSGVKTEENNAIEHAFDRADHRMYDEKRTKMNRQGL